MASMHESVTLIATNETGDHHESIEICFTTRPPYQLKATRNGAEGATFTGTHLMNCLRQLRFSLESEGLLLCCQGARPDVTLSGMQSQMADGRFVYVFDKSTGTVGAEQIDIFAPADCADVVSTTVQRAEVFSFYGLEDPRAEH
ncbi:hypothetical protein [Streptomyces chumphonensis]|uniref:hypothetical protein n=1 Tax=Streptomyces chumphonensis TaxID=1214925 RepID=UPI003D7452A1